MPDDVVNTTVGLPPNLVHIQLEREQKSRSLAFGVELLRNNYHHNLPSYYEKVITDKNDYYDRTLSVGVFARGYKDWGIVRFYVQLSVYYNDLKVRQPIVIPYIYGTYIDEINADYQLFSGAVAFGYSIGTEHWRFEPYFQIGISELPSTYREPFVMVGSVGAMRARPSNIGIILTPISIKYQFAVNRK